MIFGHELSDPAPLERRHRGVSDCGSGLDRERARYQLSSHDVRDRCSPTTYGDSYPFLQRCKLHSALFSRPGQRSARSHEREEERNANAEDRDRRPARANAGTPRRDGGTRARQQPGQMTRNVADGFFATSAMSGVGDDKHEKSDRNDDRRNEPGAHGIRLSNIATMQKPGSTPDCPSTSPAVGLPPARAPHVAVEPSAPAPRSRAP